MSPAVLLFAGAPESSSLDWDHPDLLDTFSEAFARFVGSPTAHQTAPVSPGLAATPPLYPAWRSIPLERQHLATGHSQDHGWQQGYHGTSFFTTSAIRSFIDELSPAQGGASQTSSESAEQVLSQFYEQSYARHNDILSSQIATVSDTGTSLRTSDTSFEATDSTVGSPLRSFSGAKEIPLSGNLTNLNAIPNASYLDSIHPQTMTVNLIIGIISVLPPRAIRTRHGADVQLVEVLVGDETKTGFGVSFWLSTSESVQGDMKSALSGLRPQDIVLMRNIALSSFQGKVYGQSLRRDMTKVHLLYRNRIDRTDPAGCYSAADLASAGNSNHQVEKTARVREWVLKFVGMSDEQKNTKGRAGLVAREVLPPDTP